MIEIALKAMWGIAVLVLLGGVMGFVKAKSKASLISSTIMAALLIAAFFLSSSYLRYALALSDITSFVLLTVGFMRMRKTGKFMPAGIMIILGLVGALIFSLALSTPQP